MGFNFVRNSRIEGLKSINSKGGHLNFFAVHQFNVTGVNLIAPGNSPNTDGMKFGMSSNINIWDSHVGTGDDCIAILFGNTNFSTIHNITCGPGHGISVGSLEKYKGEKNVEGVTVWNSVFTRTTNGIRFKTWESPISELTVSKFVYKNIKMIDVQLPINIDQKYCPYPPCPAMGDSRVKIRDVTLESIWGTSRSKVAVNLKCSKSFPCEDIRLIDIMLIHKGPGGPASHCIL